MRKLSCSWPWVAILVLCCCTWKVNTANRHMAALSLPDLAASYWSPMGLKLPSKEFVDAVDKAKLPVIDHLGHERDLLIVTIASEFAFEKMMDLFLESLKNITFPTKSGTSHLAKHTVINVMTTSTKVKCDIAATKYETYCTEFSNPLFSSGNFGYGTDEFWGIGFTKTATILDALTLGVDVLFLDADQVLFKNPFPYLIEREVDVLVSGDCHNHGDLDASERFAPVNNNIGFVYFRNIPTVLRAVYNWAYHLAWLAHRGEKPWDQTTFAGCMEALSTDVTRRHMTLGMLHPDLFPYQCMGSCGCDLRNIPYWTPGNAPARQCGNEADGVFRCHCAKRLTEEWYAYHFPCGGTMNDKANSMRSYADMYMQDVGPINCKSQNMTVLL